MFAKDVMTKQVVTVAPDAAVEQVAHDPVLGGPAVRGHVVVRAEARVTSELDPAHATQAHGQPLMLPIGFRETTRREMSSRCTVSTTSARSL